MTSANTHTKTAVFTSYHFRPKNHWRDNSLPYLIKQSAKQLLALVNAHGSKHIYLVPPGCGLGKLDWNEDVKPLLEPFFDDRFTIVFR